MGNMGMLRVRLPDYSFPSVRFRYCDCRLRPTIAVSRHCGKENGYFSTPNMRLIKRDTKMMFASKEQCWALVSRSVWSALCCMFSSSELDP